MVNIEREKKAINAYLKLLQNKGAKSGMLYKRSLFLDKLTPLLADAPLLREVYSQALETLMKNVPAEEWHESLSIAREFYPFWVDDIKSIAAFSLHGGFDISPVAWKPTPATLKSLTDALKKHTFSVAERGMLDAYVEMLKEKGAEKSQVETHLKLARLLILRLKGAPVDDDRVYRIAVDSILPLFEMNDTKHLFLFVIREFYPVWLAGRLS